MNEEHLTHFVIQCSCGIAIKQCDCPGPKKVRIIKQDACVGCQYRARTKRETNPTEDREV